MKKTPSPKRTAPRRAAAVGPLTRERIVAAALEEIAASGLSGFSTRKLGERLGVEAMSIYHHFPSKQHLLDALVDHAVGSVEIPPPDLAPLERLRRSMYAYRAMAHRHPALFPLVAVHRLNTPTGVSFIEAILTLVRAAVPDAELAARHFRTIGYFLTGAGLDETSGYAKGPSAAEPVSDEFIGSECPNLVASARYFKADQWDATFAHGVDGLIEAVKRDARRLQRERRAADDA
jgi:AcrR family transcriptional regulator